MKKADYKCNECHKIFEDTLNHALKQCPHCLTFNVNRYWGNHSVVSHFHGEGFTKKTT